MGGSRWSVWSRSQGAGGTRREPESWRVTTGRVGLGGIPAEGGRLPARLAFPTACSSQPTAVRTLAEQEFYELRGLTFLVGVELVLRAVLGLLNDQFPSLDIDFELQFLRDPQRFCLHLWEGGRGGKGKKRQWSSLLGAFSVPPMSASSL